MSKTADVLSQFKTQLSGSSDLSYVKNVFLGRRERIVTYPTIIIDYLGTDETDEIYDRQELNLKVVVIGIINTPNEDKQIVGDTNTKGIINFEHDIKKAISSDRTIGGYAVWTKILSSRTDEYENYPMRAVALEVDIQFRQDSDSRT